MDAGFVLVQGANFRSRMLEADAADD
jgi:hypothetical protein